MIPRWGPLSARVYESNWTIGAESLKSRRKGRKMQGTGKPKSFAPGYTRIERAAHEQHQGKAARDGGVPSGKRPRGL
jgi:hypothetical protein